MCYRRGTQETSAIFGTQPDWKPDVGMHLRVSGNRQREDHPGGAGAAAEGCRTGCQGEDRVRMRKGTTQQQQQ